MKKSLFTKQELTELATPYHKRIQARIRVRDIDGAIALTDEMAGSQIILHDFFAASCTVLWSWIGDRFGEDAIDPMFRYIFARSAKGQFFDAAGAQVMPHLSVYLLAKSWRAHSCSGKGENPGKFSITEDKDKFTFHLNPCGSGSRLWKKGWYTPGAGGKLSENSHPWTYNRKHFPYYCIHCPFLNEILPYESTYGALLWPVDPPADDSDTCAWHIYKDPNTIPSHYYDRVGLTKNTIKTGPYPARKKPFFTKNELLEMARPMSDRIIEKLTAGDVNAARKLCRRVKDEFLVLHDLYVNMLASTLSYIFEMGGETAVGDALGHQYDLCINRQIVKPVSKMPIKNKVSFLANYIFGTDNCNGSGYYPGKLKLDETDRDIIFTLNPCGSGGRLLRAGAYKPLGKFQKWREGIETGSITFLSRHLPLPEPLVRSVFPLIVTHFTQRKPFGLRKTINPQAWSFNRTEIPYFCCQCGMIQNKMDIDHLRIVPPIHGRDVCVWKLKK